MNKKMRMLRAKMSEKLEAVKSLNAATDKEAVAKLMDEFDALEKEFNIEQRIYNASKGFAEDHAEDEGLDSTGADKASTGFAVIAKMLRGQGLDETEMALVTPSAELSKALITGTNATSGENYLVPEDVRTEINLLRKTYVEAKKLCTLIQTESLAGNFTFESGTPAGLIAFDDGGAISDTGGDPSFERKPFAIKFYGKIIPVSNILTGAEKAGLMAYLNIWFLRNAILTENTKIFACLKEGKTAEVLTGWETLKTSINVDLDPSSKIGGVIVTNQSGFNYMDTEKDSTGRPILQSNPANSTQKLFQDMPIVVFPNSQLPDVTGKHPFFYGRTDAGCWFIEFVSLLFASSSHAGFSKNQTQMRVIEGFDVIGADKDAYCYGLMGASA